MSLKIIGIGVYGVTKVEGTDEETAETICSQTGFKAREEEE